ncbi:TlpA disulfide reductase family protein [Mangrovibacterium diazotrophicum]|uniref:Peroxiredoxin n=1 Tax=Mangrovibacterium diazotrophicum TaxID=1261403 RepID=A0A419W8B7_9BACT|nr:TlpA disulfide reductase family protein [Mangrovibacterium diazotrophicum]RKD91717.1 peroxiredoxin [Mangrovibacterium diazotrophicum]
MRKFGILLLVLATAIVACNDASQYKIQGKISNADGNYIYLDELKVSSTEAIDSVMVKEDGTFSFEGNVSYPTFFLLRLNPNNFVTLLVDSAEHVNVAGDAANFSREYSVTGSEGSLFVQELNKHLSRTKHQLDSIRSLQLSFRNDAEFAEKKKQWDQEYYEVRQNQVEYSQKFVSDHPFSMANVLALYQKFDDDTYVIQDLQSLKLAASALNSFYPESEHVKALYGNTLKLMAEERAAKMKQMIQEQGVNSPDIVLPNPDGKEIALSSLRGKYVLLQFWSAMDRGSRIANPVLVELYKKYKSKGFEIYQVSVDENRYEWLDAIDKDKLTWTNVGDMKGSNQAVSNYNVTNIPLNYLLDKDGVIIARDLKGPNLDRLLGEILN